MINKVFKNITHLMIIATLILNSTSVLPIFAIGVASDVEMLNQEAINLDEFIDEETHEEIILEEQIQEDQNSDNEDEGIILYESTQEELGADEGTYEGGSLRKITQDTEEIGANLQSASEREDITVSNFRDLEMAIENAGNTPTTLIIADEIVFTSTITIGSDQEIVIRPLDAENSVLLIREENNGGRHFEVNGVLTLEYIILDGNHVLGGVIVNAGGDFTMNKGEIRNSDANSGGGVSVNQGRFEMNGGVIHNNRVVNTGGGVRVEDGTFIMNSGELINNDAILMGGGIRIVGDTYFSMIDGEISNNTARSGGGISVYSNAVFEMNGGWIQNNQAGAGGGVATSINTRFIMNGGFIRENVAETAGGGARVEFNSVIIINDGTITENEVLSGGVGSVGGGVSLNGGSRFEMNGGEISKNTADNGGGVRIASADTIFIINDGDGIIRSNVARSTGGGVSAGANTTFEMYGGVIHENLADVGGGVSIESNGSFTLNQGTISGNHANNYGGGATVDNAIITMNSGVIENNQATYGGGVYVANRGRFNFNRGTIEDNEAIHHGGGIYVDFLERSTVARNIESPGLYMGGSLFDNTAGGDGGAVFFELPIEPALIANSDLRFFEDATIKGNVAHVGGGIASSAVLDEATLLALRNFSIDSSVQFADNIATSGVNIADDLARHSVIAGRINTFHVSQYTHPTGLTFLNNRHAFNNLDIGATGVADELTNTFIITLNTPDSDGGRVTPTTNVGTIEVATVVSGNLMINLSRAVGQHFHVDTLGSVTGNHLPTLTYGILEGSQELFVHPNPYENTFTLTITPPAGFVFEQHDSDIYLNFNAQNLRVDNIFDETGRISRNENISPGTSVTLEAGTHTTAGVIFSRWELLSGTLPPDFNLTNPSQTFNMPANELHLRAVWQSPLTIDLAVGTGSIVIPSPLPEGYFEVGTPITITHPSRQHFQFLKFAGLPATSNLKLGQLESHESFSINANSVTATETHFIMPEAPVRLTAIWGELVRINVPTSIAIPAMNNGSVPLVPAPFKSLMTEQDIEVSFSNQRDFDLSSSIGTVDLITDSELADGVHGLHLWLGNSVSNRVTLGAGSIGEISERLTPGQRVEWLFGGTLYMPVDELREVQHLNAHWTVHFSVVD